MSLFFLGVRTALIRNLSSSYISGGWGSVTYIMPAFFPVSYKRPQIRDCIDLTLSCRPVRSTALGA